MPALFFATILTVITITVNSQTLVIAFRTKDTVYVGVDSRTRIVQTEVKTKLRDTIYGNLCKIDKIGNYYMSVSGPFGRESFMLAKQAAKDSKNYMDMVYRYNDLFGKRLWTILDSIKRNDPLVYEQFPFNYTICTGIFYGFEKDSSFVHFVTYDHLPTTNGSVQVEGKVRVFMSDIPIPSGSYEEIMKELYDLNKWKAKPKKQLILELIKKQCKNRPDIVGEPIHIIQITRSGSKWLHNGCFFSDVN